MFSFLSPLFLYAAAAAVVPLVLHLLQKRRVVRIPFSTIRFLELAHRRSSSRLKMEHFILWLLRTLMVLLLAMAFAMPILQTRRLGAMLGRATRDLAIVIDASYSMGYQRHAGTVWDEAAETALDLINGLQEGDRVCIFAARDHVEPVIERLTADRELASLQVKGLELGATTSKLAPAVAAACDSLARDDKGRAKELHIITDGQALAWSGFAGAPGRNEGGPAPSGWGAEDMGKKTALFVTMLGVDAPENMSPTDVKVTPELLVSDMAPQIVAKLVGTGPHTGGTAALYIDGEKVGERASELGAEGAREAAFNARPLRPGTYAAYIQTPPDNLPVDNRFHFLLRVFSALPTLCVGSQDDVFFLARALDPGGKGGSGLTVAIAEGRNVTDGHLRSCACVFLCNALPLRGQTMDRIQEYVRRGGLLVIFPGERAVPADYEAWECLEGIAPGGIRNAPAADRKRALRWDDTRHALLRGLVPGPGGAPVLTVQRELTWPGTPESGEVLVVSGAEAPFLVSRRFGGGEVLVFALSADRLWGNLPLSPFFLPMVHRIVQHGAGSLGRKPAILTTRSLRVDEHLPWATGASVLMDPAGNRIPIRGTIDGTRRVLHAEDLMAPGVYEFAERAGDTMEPALALNVNRAESDLTPLRDGDIPRIVAVKGVKIGRGREELRQHLVEHRIGKTMGEQLLWLAFLLAAVEVVYANRRNRPVAPLSESLKVGSSGRVSEVRTED